MSDQPRLFDDMEDDASMDAVFRKESVLGEQIDRQAINRTPRWDGPFARELSAIRVKHMAPGDYDGLDDFDPDGFDEFGGDW